MKILELFSLLSVLAIGVRAHAYDSGDGYEWDTEDVQPMMGGINQDVSSLTIYDPFHGVRNVSYFVVDGYAIIDGDVLFGSVESLLAHALPPNLGRADYPPTYDEFIQSPYYGSRLNDGSRQHRYNKRAVTFRQGLFSWPGARLSYNFESARTEQILGRDILEAFRRWKVRAPYFTFTRAGNAPVARGVVTVKAGSPGCFAMIGNRGPQSTEMFVNLEPNTICKAAAVHELGHVLGFFHEHQRADRESTLRFQCQALNPDCKGDRMPQGRQNCCGAPFPGTRCCQMISNFELLRGPQFDNSGQFDTQSTMMYQGDAFAIPGQRTLVPARPGVQLPTGPIGFPSNTDVGRLCRLYPRECRARMERNQVLGVEDYDEWYGVDFSDEELEAWLASDDA